MYDGIKIRTGNVRFPTLCRYLATKALWESRCSWVSSISPSFNRFSYSWEHWQPQETRDVPYLGPINSGSVIPKFRCHRFCQTDLEQLLCDLPLHRRNILVIAELRDAAVPQPQQAEPPGLFQLLVRGKIELFLQLLQAEILRSRHLGAGGHLPMHKQLPAANPDATFWRFKNLWESHLQKLHNGCVLRVIGIESGLLGPFSDFLHVVQTWRSNVWDGVLLAQTTEHKHTDWNKINNKYLRIVSSIVRQYLLL